MNCWKLLEITPFFGRGRISDSCLPFILLCCVSSKMCYHIYLCGGDSTACPFWDVLSLITQFSNCLSCAFSWRRIYLFPVHVRTGYWEAGSRSAPGCEVLLSEWKSSLVAIMVGRNQVSILWSSIVPENRRVYLTLPQVCHWSPVCLRLYKAALILANLFWNFSNLSLMDFFSIRAV